LVGKELNNHLRFLKSDDAIKMSKALETQNEKPILESRSREEVLENDENVVKEAHEGICLSHRSVFPSMSDRRDKDILYMESGVLYVLLGCCS
jgi:hypothetical protein